MARWRLTAPHYINVPGTEWEYKETNRDTGRQARKVFEVPLHLDPDMPSDQNYPGEVIVCHEGKGQGRDIVFLGEPTPDMEPVDDEARELSESLKHKWVHPIESLSSTGNFGDGLIEAFQKQMAQIMAGQNTSTKGIDPAEFAKLQAQVMELTSQLKAKTERRV